jgi:hypothetical protein
VLAGIRSFPVYGKLDFLLVDGRPWWNSWQPMIESVMDMGTQPILTDSTTSTVLRAVFNQPAVAFRFNYHFSLLEVEELVKKNQYTRERFPVGGLLLLLHDKFQEDKNVQIPLPDASSRLTIKQLMIEFVELETAIDGKDRETPYRCIINLHGFTPSWVSSETKHWSRWLSFTSSMYTMKGVRLSDLEGKIKGQPFDNCIVFY